MRFALALLALLALLAFAAPVAATDIQLSQKTADAIIHEHKPGLTARNRTIPLDVARKNAKHITKHLDPNDLGDLLLLLILE